MDNQRNELIKDNKEHVVLREKFVIFLQSNKKKILIFVIVFTTSI
jgi:hypothetical protein